MSNLMAPRPPLATPANVLAVSGDQHGTLTLPAVLAQEDVWLSHIRKSAETPLLFGRGDEGVVMMQWP